MSKFVAFLKNESGATAIDYSLIVAGISLTIIAAVQSVGGTVNSKFTAVANDFK
jgi:pilus assembly protein Flp/PilA